MRNEVETLFTIIVCTSLTAGGGTVLIRNTGVQAAEYKYFSVREIDTSID